MPDVRLEETRRRMLRPMSEAVRHLTSALGKQILHCWTVEE